jgi:hypothetical protein
LSIHDFDTHPLTMAINSNSATATYGLRATAEAASAEVSGTLQIGPNPASLSLPLATHAFTFAVEVDGAGEVTIDMTDGSATVTGSGTPQVETQTIVGTISSAGAISVVLTGVNIAGSPLTIPVTVANSDSASTVAGKVKTALNVSAITNAYTIGGTGANITLTANPIVADDSTLNIAYTNGTATGLTVDATSVSTTAGVAPAKCYRLSGVAFANDNFEGLALPADIAATSGLLIRGSVGPGTLNVANVAVSLNAKVKSTGFALLADSASVDGLEGSEDITFSATGGYSKSFVTLIVIEA